MSPVLYVPGKPYLYSDTDLQDAYSAWAGTQELVTVGSIGEFITTHHHSLRKHAWNRYCDVRDGLAPGESAKRAQRHLTRSEADSEN